MPKDKESFPTPPDALNAITNLLGDILEGLTIVELFAGRGEVSRRLLQAGASTAVCVDNNTPEDHIEDDNMIWLPMDALEFLQEQRVRDVGLVYSAPPYGSELNRQVLELLPESPIVTSNCLVILEEPTWKYVPLDNYPRYQLIESFRFDETRIAVTQMLEPEDIPPA